MVADSYSIWARWKNRFSQLFSVHGVSDVRQIEMHTAEPLVPEPSAFEVDMAIDNIKRYISPAIDQIQQNLLKLSAGQFVLRSVSTVLVFGIARRMEGVDKKGDKTDCSILCFVDRAASRRTSS